MALLSVFPKADLLDAARAGGFSGVLSFASPKEQIVRAVLRLLQAGDRKSVARVNESAGSKAHDYCDDFVEAFDPAVAGSIPESSRAGPGSGASLPAASVTPHEPDIPLDTRAADGNVDGVDFDSNMGGWEADLCGGGAAPADLSVPLPTGSPLSAIIESMQTSVRANSQAHERKLMPHCPGWFTPAPKRTAHRGKGKSRKP
jgi:hypothetical protein